MVQVKIGESGEIKTKRVINKVIVDTDRTINIAFYSLFIILLFIPRLLWKIGKAIVKTLLFLFEGVVTIIGEIFSGW
jgi:hypothetical protein